MVKIKLPKLYEGLGETCGAYPPTFYITGDGNCFFRALAFSVCGDEDQYRIFRRDIVTFIRRNPERLHMFLDTEMFVDIHDYLQKSRMACDAVWASEVVTYHSSPKVGGSPKLHRRVLDAVFSFPARFLEAASTKHN